MGLNPGPIKNINQLAGYTVCQLEYPHVSNVGGSENLKFCFSCLVSSSVADPDPGSGAFLTPGSGSGIRNRFFPDPGSRIPDPKPIFSRA